jgi:hypothetical protein
MGELYIAVYDADSTDIMASVNDEQGFERLALSLRPCYSFGVSFYSATPLTANLRQPNQACYFVPNICNYESKRRCR